MIYLTADQHWGHQNIIGYTNRPFENVHHMNKVLQEKYCERVKENDIVYFLGDVSMSNDTHKVGSFVEWLPGTKHLILGNHDKLKPWSYHEIGFSSVHTALTIEHEGITFYLAHDPAFAQIPNTIWLCGHIHNLWRTYKSQKLNTFLINCGVDVWDFSVVSIDEIMEILRH